MHTAHPLNVLSLHVLTEHITFITIIKLYLNKKKTKGDNSKIRIPVRCIPTHCLPPLCEVKLSLM